MQSLPIDSRLPEIVAALQAHRNLVLVAEPGAGKTTRVPPALLQASLCPPNRPEIWMLQPRRVAARAAAARIADEQGWELGQDVGFQVRFENKTSNRTRLRVVTEGILNRRLQTDPGLEKVGAVILDEFHERSLHTDIAIALLRELQESVREDLHILVMSATLEAEPVARFLADCPVLNVEGRAYPVEVHHAERSLPLQTGPDFITAVADKTRHALDATTEQDGNLLVFLPGAGEIARVMQALSDVARARDVQLAPLHGSLPAADQDLALKPSSRRKIICATNIAETSLTIDGVTTVVDSGFARQTRTNRATGLERLELVRISRNSSRQRAGRAGRQRPGRCFRLWTKLDEAALPEADEPEIRRVDLSETVLLLAQWGVTKPAEFAWFEPPERSRLTAAVELLRLLGALQSDGRLSELGGRCLSWPLHPRLACVMEEARRLPSVLKPGVGNETAMNVAARIAALLSEKDILSGSIRGQHSSPTESDLVLRLELLEHAVEQRFARHHEQGVDSFAARNVARVAESLLRAAGRDKSQPGAIANSVVSADVVAALAKRLVLAGFPDRVCRRRRPRQPEARMVGGQGLRLDDGTSVQSSELFICLDTRERQLQGRQQTVISLASGLERAWLEERFPQLLSRKNWIEINPESGKALACSARVFLDLPLEEPTTSVPGPEQLHEVLVAAVLPRWPRIVESQPETAQWLRRLEFLRQNMPDAAWPEIGEAEIHEAITAACMGERDVGAVEAKSFYIYFDALLNERQRKLLRDQAPSAITVPSGRQISIEYREALPPVLEVRIQEVFGWLSTPKLADGRIPLTLHLLGPNYRPVQVTSDLGSFWKNGYPEVRKELRARYPKHSWPEDPITAKAEAKGASQRRK